MQTPLFVNAFSLTYSMGSLMILKFFLDVRDGFTVGKVVGSLTKKAIFWFKPEGLVDENCTLDRFEGWRRYGVDSRTILRIDDFFSNYLKSKHSNLCYS